MAEVGFIWADDADLRAIYVYVENQRRNINRYPGLQNAIEQFEQWYQSLTWFDVHVMINDTLAEAARRRNQINAIQGNNPDPTITPADRIAPEHTAPGSTTLPGKAPPLVPERYKFAVTVGAGALAALVILKKLYIL